MPPVDGVAITAGSGTTILTDDTGAGGHAQVIKLAISTDGSGTLVPASVADGLTVNLGTNNDVTVTGTVAVTQSGTWDEVGINDSGNSITVDNGGTFATQVDGAALTALQLIDDPVQVLGTDVYTEAASKGITIGAVRRDADTTLVSLTNEFGPLQMDANGRLKVEAFSGEALPVTFTGSTDVATQTTLASLLTSSQLIDDAIYASDAALNKSMAIGAVLDDTGTVAITENQAGYVRMSSRRALLVEGVASGTAQNVLDTNSAAALTAVQKIDDPVLVDDAAFTVGTSSVMMAGRQAVAHGSNPDAADALDAVVGITNRHRVQFVIGGHPNVVSYTHTAITTAVTDSALITVSAGTKIVVTRITVTLDSASTVYPSVRIGFGTANVPALGNAGVIAAHGGVPAGGGFTIGDGSGIIGIGGDDQDLRITTVGVATGNGVQVSISYYTIES